MKIITTILALILSVSGLKAQERIPETLTLDQAIDRALQNNKDILIQRNEVSAVENDLYKGNAGLLPTVNLIGGASYNNGFTDVTIRTFQPENPQVQIDDNGVASETYSAVVQADYTLINGFAGKYRYKLLENGLNLARYEQEQLINNTVVAVTMVFIEIAKLQGREDILKSVLKNERERAQKIGDRFEFGQATGLDVLQTQTNINNYERDLDEVFLAKENLNTQLNFLIGGDLQTSHQVSAIYTLKEAQTPAVIVEGIKANNPAIKLAAEGVTLSQNQINLARSELYPRLSLRANYGYFNQQNDLQQLAELTTLGYTVGATLSYNIFNGTMVKREISKAKINMDSERIRNEQALEYITSLALQEYNKGLKLRAQLTRETANLETFNEAFERISDRYFNGKASNLDISDAQAQLLNAQVNLLDIQLDLIASEVSLDALMGNLLGL